MFAPIEKLPRNGGVPIKFFLTDNMMPDEETISQLERLANSEGLAYHVAVLPDIHRKGRNPSPTGTVVASKNTLLPRAVDKGMNCGMRMVRTDIDAKDLTAAVLDALFAELMQEIPVMLHDDDVISEDDVLDILLNGGAWSQKKFGLSDEEMANIEDRGTFATDAKSIDDILASVSQKALNRGPRCFGTIGDGNHFLELQEIVEVLEPDVAHLLGLEKGKAFFMMHTGSRSVGSKTMKHYLKEWEPRYLEQQANGSPIWAIPADSEDGVKYARAAAAASNFGFANRIAITEKLRAAVRTVLRDDSLSMPLLFDCGHVTIKKEQWNGDQLWIHRHGASRALPASQMAWHPVFSQTGQPIPIPGSMGHASFVGVTDEKAVESFYSVNHGAGRVMDKPEAVEHFTENQVEKEMRDKNIRLYRYRSDNIAEQAPSSFKDITSVISAMAELAIAKPVVRLRPLAVLKG